MSTWTMTNVVAACHLNIRVDLDSTCNKFGAMEKSKKIPCIIWRHKRINGTALLFSSGYMSVHGNTDVSNARKSVRQFARLLDKKGYKARLNLIRILTISAACRLTPAPIDLCRLSLFVYSSSYEPELFPALIFTKGKIKMLIYSSGAIVISGIKNSHASRKSVNEMLNVILVAKTL